MFGGEFSRDHANGVVYKQMKLFTGYLDQAGINYEVTEGKEYERRYFWHGGGSYMKAIGTKYNVKIKD